jgi:hypothetical protein
MQLNRPLKRDRLRSRLDRPKQYPLQLLLHSHLGPSSCWVQWIFAYWTWRWWKAVVRHITCGRYPHWIASQAQSSRGVMRLDPASACQNEELSLDILKARHLNWSPSFRMDTVIQCILVCSKMGFIYFSKQMDVRTSAKSVEAVLRPSLIWLWVTSRVSKATTRLVPTLATEFSPPGGWARLPADPNQCLVDTSGRKQALHGESNNDSPYQRVHPKPSSAFI